MTINEAVADVLVAAGYDAIAGEVATGETRPAAALRYALNCRLTRQDHKASLARALALVA